MTDLQHFFNRDLPKWPKMLVTGKPVTVEQAQEIIRRTDSFFGYFGGGNNHKYIARVREALGMSPSRTLYDSTPEERRVASEKMDTWREEWGYIYTEYVINSWISCNFIFGPHGWCHPDGTIFFADNVGKWPSVREVYEDWNILARHFPFLEVDITLFDGEAGKERIKPVVSMRVREGVVLFSEEIIHRDPSEGARRDFRTLDQFLPFYPSEQGIPWEWIEKWSSKKKDFSL